MDTDPISTLLDSIAAGAGIPAQLYAPGAVLDAVVPMWRLEAHGPAAIAAQLSGWYADPGAFTDVVRTPLPNGELLRYTLEWAENGAPWASHQVHVVAITDGLIVRHEVWCGGRWDASVQAEIEAGLLTAREAS
ncbi:MAG: hypothetical protein QOI76_829 [Frankiales bacterium]|jgi:hypothetical protein|nr:hypothetical protein [Frankiales bacterium]